MRCLGAVQVFVAALVLYSILSAKAIWAQGVASQAGFISIDCGATESYVDPVTGIKWDPDGNYTSAGVNFVNVPGTATLETSYPGVSTLRYFPEPRTKYCYELPGTTPNSSYMIRHTHWNGSYDKSSKVPSFMVAIDSTTVSSFDYSSPSLPWVFEHIYKAQKNIISFCLHRDETNSIPFISTLELRPFQAGASEQKALVDGRTLFHIFRFNYGDTIGKKIRYPDDEYDRIWTSWLQEGLVTISTTSPVDPNDLPLMPPSAVMQTAQTNGVLGPIQFLGTFLPAAAGVECVLNMYFAEIGANSSATSRAFNISIGNFPTYTENIYVEAGGPFKSTVRSVYSWTLDRTSNISLVPLPTSTYPPLLNAVEIYAIMPPTASPTTQTDVVALGAIKAALNLSLSSGGDPCLPVPYDWVTCTPGNSPRVTAVKLSRYNLSGEIPAEFGSLTALTTLWLDNNALIGIIPDMSKLTNLKSLHLQNNALGGAIPASLGALPLTELYLQNNKFVGLVPDSLKKNTLKLDVSGNPGINDPSVYSGPSSPSAPSPSPGNGGSLTKKKSNVALFGGVIGGVVAAIVLIGCLAVIIWTCRKRRAPKGDKNNLLDTPREHRSIKSGLVPGALRYSLAEIIAATSNFKVKIGSGGFGPVYSGRLASGEKVAVKVSDGNSQQGSQEFRNEVELLSRIHHRNLVSLLGYCEEDNRQMLVYEFLPKGTVREHLYGSDRAVKEPLDWRSRLDIALDAAQGLEYLHTGCNPNIIHRDIKSSNILLTDKYVAKVADFGLSKLAPQGDATHVVTRVAGTAGYVDPEYWGSNALTEKSDVFSFGVVLLEMLCGRVPIDNTLSDESQWNLVNWVRASLQAGDMDRIMDPALARCNPNMDGVWRVADLAMKCVEPKGRHRPLMQNVVRELRETITMNKSSRTHGYVDNSSHDPYKPRNGSGHASSTLTSSNSYNSVPFSNNSMMRPHVR